MLCYGFIGALSCRAVVKLGEQTPATVLRDDRSGDLLPTGRQSHVVVAAY